MKKTETKSLINNYRLKIKCWAAKKITNRQAKKIGNTDNTLTILPQYLKKPHRFWTTNIGEEIRSTFDLELYEKVCQSRGVESGVETIY